MNTTYLTKYFSKEGITSSQANFVADQIKEENKKVASEIANSRAYNEIMINFRESGNITLNDGESVDLERLAQKEGKLYALSSWLREAISARQKLIDYYSSCDVNEFVTIPVFSTVPPVPEKVTSPVSTLAEDVLATFSVADLAEYYKLQACAAHIGKYIHQGGHISTIREEILLAREKTTTFQKLDDVSYPIRHVAIYSVEEIDKIFKNLQNIHREYEQKLNNYKARIQNGITELNVARQTAYRDESKKVLAEYQLKFVEYQQQVSAYNSLVEQLTAEASAKRSLKIKEVSSWKILIPNDLADIYELIVNGN